MPGILAEGDPWLLLFLEEALSGAACVGGGEKVVVDVTGKNSASKWSQWPIF